MSKWTIDKQFSFCYGHRVWSQKLNPEFCEAEDTKAKCRHLHGHEGLVHVFLEGDKLERGMLTDFKHLGWLKNFLDKNLDHRFILDKNDPMYYTLVISLYKDISGKEVLNLLKVKVPGTDHTAGYEVDLAGCNPNTAGYETLEGYFIVDFAPTSENLSKWLFDCASAKMSYLSMKVSQVDWYETPKSRSSYRG